MDNYIIYADGTESHSSSIRVYGMGMCHSSTPVCRNTWNISTNCPILPSKTEAENYLNGISDSSIILNYSKSIYDNIIDNNDLPTFYKSWQQELWERVANAPDDVIDWVGLNSLSEYSGSIQDVYEKSIDDILDGVYDRHEDIPNTYSNAWEMAASDAWEDIIDMPTAGSLAGENTEEDNTFIKPTQKELDIIKDHLSGDLQADFNDAIIEKTLQEGGELKGPDAEFYRHELEEADLMSKGMDYDTAHNAALAKYSVAEFDLYHPDVIKSMPEWFGPAWFEYWGISQYYGQT